MSEEEELQQFAERLHEEIVRCSQDDDSGAGGSFEEIPAGES